MILTDLGANPAFQVAQAIERAEVPGVLEAWCAYDTVGLSLDADNFRLDLLELAVAQAALGVATEPRTHQVPVCYRLGEDLEESASALGLQPDELAERHAATVYRCHAVGFCPGFPYLGYLPDRLCGLPRRPRPRVRVRPGSVGITGNQTGIYPMERPGGWSLIGVTPLAICDWQAGFFPIAAGDLVRFVPIDERDFDGMLGKRLGDL